MDNILHNHELYCTVCDYNNGSCEVHNTVKEMKINHQSIPFDQNRILKMNQTRFTGMIPISAFYAGAVSKPVRTYR